MIWVWAILIVVLVVSEMIIIGYAWAGYRYSKEYIDAISRLNDQNSKLIEITSDLEKALEETRR